MQSYVASHLKDMNRQVVYNLISNLGTTSKVEISKKTNISAPTTIKIVNYLIDEGLVLERGEGQSAIGRKPRMLTLNREFMYSASCFFEGEFLSLGIVNISGEIVFKKSLRCSPGLDDIMGRIEEGLIEELFAEAGIPLNKMLGIGIALPAIYDPVKQMIVAAPLIGIKHPTDISGRIASLSEKYGVRVLVENDTNAQCLGEFKASGMDEKDDLILLSVGTGLGAGVILGGKLRRGANNMGGEIGYFSFMDDSVSDLYHSGWLEQKISYRRLEDKFGINVNTDLSALPEKMLELVLEYVSVPLALCINNIVMLLDCNTVRIGGIVANMFGDLLTDSVNDKLRNLCISDIHVEKQTSEDIGLIGTASSMTEKKIHEILTLDH